MIIVPVFILFFNFISSHFEPPFQIFMDRPIPALVLSPQFEITTTHVTCYGMTVPRYIGYFRNEIEYTLDIASPEYQYIPRAVFIVKNFFRDILNSPVPFNAQTPHLPFHQIFFQYYSVANGITKENFYKPAKIYRYWM